MSEASWLQQFAFYLVINCLYIIGSALYRRSTSSMRLKTEHHQHLCFQAGSLSQPLIDTKLRWWSGNQKTNPLPTSVFKNRTFRILRSVLRKYVKGNHELKFDWLEFASWDAVSGHLAMYICWPDYYMILLPKNAVSDHLRAPKKKEKRKSWHESALKDCTSMLTKNCQVIGKKLASIVSVLAFSLDRDGIKWCNDAAWITADGFESLSRRDPDRLKLKFRSTLTRMKWRNGRCRSSQVELTSKITPATINSLQCRKSQWVQL